MSKAKPIHETNENVIKILKYLSDSANKTITTKQANEITTIEYKQTSALLVTMANKGYLKKIKIGEYMFVSEFEKIHPNTNKVFCGFKLLKLYPGCLYKVGHIVESNNLKHKLFEFPDLWKPLYKKEEIKNSPINKGDLAEALEYLKVCVSIIEKLI